MSKRRYSIVGREYGSDHDVELAQCDNNPAAVLDGFKAKSLTIRNEHKRAQISKYTWLRIVDNEVATSRSDVIGSR
jgi:hypothetical protein